MFDNEDKAYIIKHYEELGAIYKYFKGFIWSDQLHIEQIQWKYDEYINQIELDKVTNWTTVNQKTVVNTYNNLCLFIYFKKYIEKNNNKIIIEDFLNELKTQLKDSHHKHDKILIKYINDNKIINSWNKMFKSIFINVDVKWTKMNINNKRQNVNIINKITYGFDLF